MAVDQRQRHREAVIHIHLVHDGHVELIENQRLRQMRREFRMAFYHRHRPRPPALIGGWKLRRTTQREGGNDLEGKRGGVIVVDEDDHVHVLFGDPLFGEIKALEYRLPIGLLGLAEVNGGADRRNMRGGQP